MVIKLSVRARCHCFGLSGLHVLMPQFKFAVLLELETFILGRPICFTELVINISSVKYSLGSTRAHGSVEV